MDRHEIEVRFEYDHGSGHDRPPRPYARSIVIRAYGEPDVEKVIAWARERYRLDADEYIVAEVKNGRAS